MTGATTESARFDLRHARLNAGLTIRGLGRVCKVHEQSIRRIEQGKPVEPPTAKAIADYFGIKVTDLLPNDRQAA